MTGMNGTFSRPTGYICNGELIKKKSNQRGKQFTQ